MTAGTRTQGTTRERPLAVFENVEGLLTPDLLIIDDFGLRRLNAQQSSDFYEVIIATGERRPS